MNVIIYASLFTVLLLSNAQAGPSKVGNGDDGADLEGNTPLLKGPIVEARQAALSLLEKLNVSGIPGLGKLIPEVKNSPLYLAQKDVSARLEEDQGSFHSSMQGLVYARTFAEPHASTRFFPVAQTLNRDQLVALHVHEALHRSLPAEIRQDEAKVTKITLSITSPDSSHDQVITTMQSELPQMSLARGASHLEEPEHYKQPSNLGYKLRVFSHKSDGLLSQPVKQMHTLTSHLYPFGGRNNPVGIGIEMAFVNDIEGFKSGPLGLSARTRIWSVRGFDMGIWAEANLNTLSNTELKNSALGRDSYTFGLSMRKDLKNFYAYNQVGYTIQSDFNTELAGQDIHYEYGGVITAQVNSGLALGQLKLGGFGGIHLGQGLRIFQNDGSNFDNNIGRYRIFYGGPELSWLAKDFSVILQGKFVLDATKEANLDFLGNLLGQGSAQGEISASVRFHL